MRSASPNTSTDRSSPHTKRAIRHPIRSRSSSKIIEIEIVETTVMEAVSTESISTRAISAKSVSPKEVGLMKRRTATDTARLEAWTGKTSSRRHRAEGVATHVAAEIAASGKTAVPTDGAATTATHLRRRRHQSQQQDDRRNGMHATHASIINPIGPQNQKLKRFVV